MGEQVAARLKQNIGKTTKWGCSSVGRAPALQAGGQEFESLHLHSSQSIIQCKVTESHEAFSLKV